MKTWLIGMAMVGACSNAHADLLDALKAFGQALQQPQQQTQQGGIPSYLADDPQQTGPGGIVANCGAIELVYDQSMYDRFNIRTADWTPEMLEFLKGITDSCLTKKLGDFPRAPADTVQKMKNEAANTKRYLELGYTETQERKKEASARRIEAEKKLVTQQCEQLPAFQLYSDQETVIGYSEIIAAYKEAQDREKLVANESGVRNLATERSLGEAIVINSQYREAYFKRYKQNGGTTTSPQKMNHAIKNPCP